MAPRDPVSTLATHDVLNQPFDLENWNLYAGDPALREAVRREGAGFAESQLLALGERLGTSEVIGWGVTANRQTPEARPFDRFGRRIDEVEFHPVYHELMKLGIENRIPSIAWTAGQPGGHAAHAALFYLFSQIESGVCCPFAMTYAVVPALRNQPDLAAQWVPRLTAGRYDPRSIPAAEKTGCTMGMFMTEKQGGSDVRANSTRARRLGADGAYRLDGHKWFCSAPMSDAFLTLAHADKGLTCFLVPRWTPDGQRNGLRLMRVKDKMGNRSNASAEIEYENAWAAMVGEEGRGVRTIIDMVQHTRLDAAIGSAALMRQAAVQAVHHTHHRSAFQRLLIQQPLMRQVLADLALESEAAILLMMRIARAFDEAPNDSQAAGFARIATAVAKFWVCKRTPGHVYEAMECFGGPGYIEESMMPRLYREAPVNSIWEGSGNVICLDVLRAMHKEPDSAVAFLREVDQGRGMDGRLDAAIAALKSELANHAEAEARARRVVERMALALQGSLMVRHAPPPVAEAFLASRLGGEGGHSYGTLPPTVDTETLIGRVYMARS